MVAELVRETRDPRRVSNSVNKHVVKRVEVETSGIIKKTTLEKINLEKINHETEYIKISQHQYTDKAVDVTVVIEEIVTQIQNNAQKISEKETQQVDLSWTSDTVNVQFDVSERHGSSLRKLMDESDMQVPDEDDRHEDPSRSKTIKANNKIVKERKTLDCPFRQQTIRL